jgi:hypothetical protein
MFSKLPAVKPGWRILAGILGCFSLFGVAVSLVVWFQRQPLEFTPRGVLLVLGCLASAAIFLFVAISGRDPMGYLLSRVGAVDERSERS